MKSKALKQGTKIEMEHTKGKKIQDKKRSKNRTDLARKIAKDHIDELGAQYYDPKKGLPALEKKLKKKSK